MARKFLGNGIDLQNSPALNVRPVPRIGSVASTATPSISCALYDFYEITALATPITGITITGTPNDGQQLILRIKDNGTAQAITHGSSFGSSGVASLVSTTVGSKQMTEGFFYDANASKWICMAADAAGY
jgi:hypothetical protein